MKPGEGVVARQAAHLACGATTATRAVWPAALCNKSRSHGRELRLHCQPAPEVSPLVQYPMPTRGASPCAVAAMSGRLRPRSRPLQSNPNVRPPLCGRTRAHSWHSRTVFVAGRCTPQTAAYTRLCSEHTLIARRRCSAPTAVARERAINCFLASRTSNGRVAAQHKTVNLSVRGLIVRVRSVLIRGGPRLLRLQKFTYGMSWPDQRPATKMQHIGGL